MTAADIRAAALALAPEIESRAEEIAQARRLPPDLLESLKAAGAFRMQMPRAWGGPEMTLREQTEVIEIYARADPSVGWCVMIGADSGFFASYLEEGAARKLFPDLDHSIAGGGSPIGRAVRTAGGYLISGRMPFASNINNAEIVTAICPVYEGEELAVVDGRPEAVMCFMGRDAVEIVDSWHTLGLAGSGSNDYIATDVFVPEDHVFPFPYGRPTRPGPLYAWMGMIQANMHGVPLGLARRSIDIVKKRAGEKREPNATRMGEPLLMKEIPRVRTNIARAEILLGATRAYSYEAMDRVWDEICRDGSPTLESRVALAASRHLAFRTGREVAALMVDTVGASAIYRTSPLESLLRDAITMGQHWTAQERTLDTIGAMALGDEPPMPGL
ncbi:acyl-CoA dehydrogenase family protein [Streptomyces justiciae]|uniref:acyl-CoA dehydrogenase family protein n=1 Tax=Streptomyces justiciae TaxID=2780140 RepID=UPI0021193AAE|nr:acyl-CoA dehydrogenase family protein [Streptomyces justiciae]MCW8378707.1 acyl-CoA dehydrogenase family protein [Streptomyces justiciae]